MTGKCLEDGVTPDVIDLTQPHSYFSALEYIKLLQEEIKKLRKEVDQSELVYRNENQRKTIIDLDKALAECNAIKHLYARLYDRDAESIIAQAIKINVLEEKIEELENR